MNLNQPPSKKIAFSFWRLVKMICHRSQMVGVQIRKDGRLSFPDIDILKFQTLSFIKTQNIVWIDRRRMSVHMLFRSHGVSLAIISVELYSSSTTNFFINIEKLLSFSGLLPVTCASTLFTEISSLSTAVKWKFLCLQNHFNLWLKFIKHRFQCSGKKLLGTGRSFSIWWPQMNSEKLKGVFWA